jgi:hypothetical protein
MTSPNAPGVTHRWTDMTVFADEVANARIWAGFHYRFYGASDRRPRREESDAVGEYCGRALTKTSAGLVDAARPNAIAEITPIGDCNAGFHVTGCLRVNRRQKS